MLFRSGSGHLGFKSLKIDQISEPENIILETLRDFEFSKEFRGVVFSTAGSINNGSRLSSLRLIMATIQRYCRY